MCVADVTYDMLFILINATSVVGGSQAMTCHPHESSKFDVQL